MEVKKFNCELCNKIYSSASSLSNHKKIYHDTDHKRAKNIDDNLYYCRHCNKKFKNRNSRWVHEKKCSIETPNKEIEKILQEVEQLKKEILLKDKVIAAQDTVIETNKLTNKTFKCVNKVLMDKNYTNNSHNTTNSHNKINNYIQIYNIGMENVLETITEKQKMQIMTAKLKSLDNLVEIVHCGEYDQFKNIIITNLKGEFAYTYDSIKGYFVAVKQADALDSIFTYRMYDLEEIYNEMEDGNKIDEKTKEIIKKFIEKCESEEPYVDENGVKYPNFKEYSKDCIRIKLYNCNQQIKNDIARLIGEHGQIMIGSPNSE